jgi:putative proteasome-type protease
LPLDLLVYERDRLQVTHFAHIDQHNEYFEMIHDTWGGRLQQVFAEIPDPAWGQTPAFEISEETRIQTRAVMPPTVAAPALQDPSRPANEL